MVCQAIKCSYGNSCFMGVSKILAFNFINNMNHNLSNNVNIINKYNKIILIVN